MATYLALDAVPVERMTKKGLRHFDSREPVVALTVGPHEAGPGWSELDLTLRHGVPAVRPDDVLSGLAHGGGAATGDSAAAHPAAPGTPRPGDRRGRRPARMTPEWSHPDRAVRY